MSSLKRLSLIRSGIMSHWYREPKRFKLLGSLIRSERTFVLNPDDFHDSELFRLREALHPVLRAQKLTLERHATERVSSVLILAPSISPSLALVPDQEPEQWAGILLIPGGLQKEASLIDLFLRNPYFKNGTKGRRISVKGAIRPFFLDIRNSPYVLSLQKQHPSPTVDNARLPLKERK